MVIEGGILVYGFKLDFEKAIILIRNKYLECRNPRKDSSHCWDLDDTSGLTKKSEDIVWSENFWEIICCQAGSPMKDGDPVGLINIIPQDLIDIVREYTQPTFEAMEILDFFTDMWDIRFYAFSSDLDIINVPSRTYRTPYTGGDLYIGVSQNIEFGNYGKSFEHGLDTRMIDDIVDRFIPSEKAEFEFIPDGNPDTY